MANNREIVPKYQDILNYSTQLTQKDEDNKLDEIVFDKSRQKWLREAFDSIVENIPRKILNYIKELNEITSNSEKNQNERVIEIVQDLHEICFDIDSASDFFKMKGFQVFEHLIDSYNEQIQEMCLNCLSTIIQNNEHIQVNLFENNKISKFLTIAMTNTNPLIKKASIGVVSAIVSNLVPAAQHCCKIIHESNYISQGFRFEYIPRLKFFRLIMNIQFTNPQLISTICDSNFIQNLSSIELNEDFADNIVTFLIRLDPSHIKMLTTDINNKMNLQRLCEKIENLVTPEQTQELKLFYETYLSV